MDISKSIIDKLYESVDVTSFDLVEDSIYMKAVCEILDCTPEDIKSGIVYGFNDFEPNDVVIERNDGTGVLININRKTIKNFNTPKAAEESLFSDGANYNW